MAYYTMRSDCGECFPFKAPTLERAMAKVEAWRGHVGLSVALVSEAGRVVGRWTKCVERSGGEIRWAWEPWHLIETESQ